MYCSLLCADARLETVNNSKQLWRRVCRPSLASYSPSSSLSACKPIKTVAHSSCIPKANAARSIAGWAGATLDPSWFVGEQTSTPSLTVDDNSRLVALQLGNCYGLLFLAAVAVLYTTTELKVVRNYLIALWIADIGHVAVCYVGLGFDRFVDVASWNSMTWGNVGATVSEVFLRNQRTGSLTDSKAFLCLTRTAYLLGLFGPDAPISSAKKIQ
ncbi:hypothetical protein diail_6905 [Diaporthe ilicicola]|nr:hypothetical protein diail_6905 [Diaporthe ilicicola]